MIRRAAIIVVAVASFGAVMAWLSACGLRQSHRAGQPFALLATVPQVAREYETTPASQKVALPAAGDKPQTPPTPESPPLTVLSEGAPALNEIALTFDDGPHPGFTEPLLKVLAEHKIRATFFLVGKMVEVAGDLVRREVAAGDTLADSEGLLAARAGNEFGGGAVRLANCPNGRVGLGGGLRRQRESLNQQPGAD